MAKTFPQAPATPESDRSSHERELLRVLIVEDSSAYAALVEQMLKQSFALALEVLHRDTLSGARIALAEQPIDCVLLDLVLPDAHELEALESVQSAAPDVAVVVLSDIEDHVIAIQAVHDGAQDFLVKRLAGAELLARAVRYAVERKRLQANLRQQALHDGLTALPNRILLLDRLMVSLARADREPSAVGVLFLDLDRFKTVNDSLGHDAGDELLIQCAARLTRVVRPSDTVARFGGDEFVILCEGLRDADEAVQVAQRARRTLARPFEVLGREIFLDASVGIACSAKDSSAETLVRDADAAMYRAKRLGSKVEVFKPAMHRAAVAELETEQELRAGIARDELRIHYQPQVELLGDSGSDDRGRPARTVGVEALLRWEHPRRGLLAPSAFIEIAEVTGLIVPIGRQVLHEACRQLAAWRTDGLVDPDFTMAVNLSLCQLGSPGLLSDVRDALAGSGCPPSCLCLEVTESALARDPLTVLTRLEQLKALGVRLALDDFGAGYSSIGSLASYPIDSVKIDRTFLQQAASSTRAAEMFAAVLGVVRAANLRELAEGVETSEQLEMLQRLGCRAGQGFMFGVPTSATELIADIAATGSRTDGDPQTNSGR